MARAPEIILTRTAFAAAHVVSDPLAERNPWAGGRPAIDWEATLAFRHSLWDQGFDLAEAMDTAQRGMGLDWPTAKELVERTMVEARAHPLKPQVACGAGTDQVAIDELTSEEAIIGAYSEQMEAIEAAGAQQHFIMPAGLQSSREIAHYGEVFRLADQARLLADPELAKSRMKLLLQLAGIG